MCRFAWRGRFLVVCSRKRHCYHRRVQGTPAPALNFFFFFFFFYLLPSRQPSIPLSFGFSLLASFFLVPNAYERRLPGTVRRCRSHIKFNESSFSFSSKATLNLYYKQFNMLSTAIRLLRLVQRQPVLPWNQFTPLLSTTLL